MAETVSPRVAKYIQKTESALARAKDVASENKQDIVHGAAAVTGAFVGAYLNKRYPDRKVAGIDPDAVGAVALGVGGMFVKKGLTRTALFGGATGMACSFAARLGAAKGEAAAAAAAAK